MHLSIVAVDKDVSAHLVGDTGIVAAVGLSKRARHATTGIVGARGEGIVLVLVETPVGDAVPHRVLGGSDTIIEVGLILCRIGGPVELLGRAWP